MSLSVEVRNKLNLEIEVQHEFFNIWFRHLLW